MADDSVFDHVPEMELRRREARRAVEEAGGGEAEGFELAEQDLIEHASHGDEHTPEVIMHNSSEEAERADDVYGEPDTENKPD